jgi:hypothetical protein
MRVNARSIKALATMPSASDATSAPCRPMSA